MPRHRSGLREVSFGALVGLSPRERAELSPRERAELSPRERAELSSGELAARAGVTKDTLRFYERRGLLAPPRRAANGYRRYPVAAITRVRMIRVAVSVGFSIEELGRILRTRDAGGAPCREVHRLASEKVESLRRDVERLTGLRTDLEDVVADWDRRLVAAGAGHRAGLLEALLERSDRRQADRNAERQRPSSPPRPR